MKSVYIEKNSKSCKTPFTPQEDDKLSKLVKFFVKKSAINWQYISQQMETRSARQCKDRWTNYLNQRINHTEFTPDENHFILKKVNEIGKKWRKIAAQMKNRTDVSVKSQYRKLMRRNANVDNVYTLCMDNYCTRRRKKSQSSDEITPQNILTPEQFDDLFNSFELTTDSSFNLQWI